MMGGLGICGRKFCCSSFLQDFVQVSIKMAKEQNFSLNSAKVSGACGRLMCCLRYEHEVYEEAIKETPPVGSVVSTKDGQGVICETKPLAKEVKVKFTEKDKETIKAYKISDIKVLSRGKRDKKDEEIEDSED
jgi:cell fate regulator YaaT (PSP1 superfamily)